MSICIVLPALCFLAPALAEGQTGDRGTLTVDIRDESGVPLQGVTVILTRSSGEQLVRERTTSSLGRIDLRFLRPDRYALTVERFGFVPIHVRAIDIVPDERQQLHLTLRSGSPPITERDEFDFSQLVLRRTPAGSELLRNRTEDLVLSTRTARDFPEFAGPSAESGPNLPPRFLVTELDGAILPSAHDLLRGPGRDRFDAAPLNSLRGIRMGLPRYPTDRSSGVGAVLDLRSAAGSGEPTTGKLNVGAYYSPAVNPPGEGGAAPWISAVVSTALRGDTVRTTSGFELRRTSELLPTLLAPETVASDALDVLRDSGIGGTLPEHASYRAERTVVSGFSKLEWELGESSSWTMLANASVLPEWEAMELPPVPEGVGAATSGRDFSFLSRILSAAESGHALELDLFVQHSSRRNGINGPSTSESARTSATAEGFVLAPIREAAGESGRTFFGMAPAGTYVGETFRLRGGMNLVFHRWSDVRPEDAATHTLLGSLGRIDSDTRLIHASEGSGRDLSFGHQQFSLFGEGRWNPVPELRLTLGARLDWERFPFEDLETDNAWDAATGIVDAIPEGSTVQVSPSAQLRWEPAALAGWGVTIAGALHPGATEPGVVGEILHSRQDVHSLRTLTLPGSDLEYRARRLTLLGPEFRAPRSESVNLRLDGALKPSFRVGAEVFSHVTDFLPRRRDLNRVPGHGLVDQFGRSHRGKIVTEGGLTVIQPGSDRRFPGFDQVWAIEADGWSETRGAAFGLTWEWNPVVAEANYRYTETRDNAPFGLTGAHIPSDGAWGNDLTEAGWIEGRSDLDRPHEFVLIGSVRPTSSILQRFMVSYRLASGLPFTPGIRDALGRSWETGWTRLEPIALPTEAQLPRAGDGWSCQARFGAQGRLQRNVCRSSPVHQLNAGLVLSLPSGALNGLGLRIDVLNLLDHHEVMRDPALFVVDGSRQATILPNSAEVDLPVVENPTFGDPIARFSDGRSFRISLEYSF